MKLIKAEYGAMPAIGSGEHPRSDGLHLSDVIRSLMEESGMTKKDSRWQKENAWAAGWLWEEVLSKLLADKFAPRVGEVILDGIIMTPDGLSIEDWVLEEYKFTWRSSCSNPLDDFAWMTQIKAYMKALRTTQCRLRVYYVMGDYKGSGPQWVTYHLKACEGEIEETWQMLRNHAAVMRSRRKNES